MKLEMEILHKYIFQYLYSLGFYLKIVNKHLDNVNNR